MRSAPTPSLCTSSHDQYIQDYNFDYSDDDQEDAAASADVENMYYMAKCEWSRPRAAHTIPTGLKQRRRRAQNKHSKSLEG